MKSVHQINAEFLRAFGLQDTRNVRRIVLTLEVGELPKLEVQRLLMPEESAPLPDKLQTVVDALKLKPQGEDQEGRAP